MIQRTLYVLAVRDLEKSAAFYRDVGFDVREIEFGLRTSDGHRIMIGQEINT
jgi:predicted lactoylglutathione lyase